MIEISFFVTVTERYLSIRQNPDAVVRDCDVTYRAVRYTGNLRAGVGAVEDLPRGNSIRVGHLCVRHGHGPRHRDQIAFRREGISFNGGVDEPSVGRFNPDQFPVIQFSVLSDRSAEDLQGIVESQVLPALADIEGILQVQATGEIEQRIQITANADRLTANGVSLFQISNALRETT